MCVGSARREARWFTLAGLAVLLIGSTAFLLGMPAVAFWGVLRPLAFVLFAVQIARSPEAARPLRGWLVLVTDGWVPVGSLFGACWLLVRYQPWMPIDLHLVAPMLWLPVQLVGASVMTGLLLRAGPASRRGPLPLVTLSALVLLIADTVALVTRRAELGAPLWLAGAAILAAALVGFPPKAFGAPMAEREEPLGLRVWQLPIPFAVAGAIWPDVDDLVGLLLVLAVVAGLAVQLLVSTSHNRGLWNRLTVRTRLYLQILRDSQDVIIQMDRAGSVEFANPAVAAMLCVEPGQLVGHRINDYLHPDDVDAWAARMRATDWSEETSIRVVARLAGIRTPGSDRPGTERHIEWTVSQMGEDSGWILTGRDITQRIALQDSLVDAATTDALTGLVNRSGFLAAVDARLESGAGAGLIFVDLDRFKSVNDTAGHALGDVLLRRAAECLRAAVGPGDLVARLGGDEFAVLTATASTDAAVRVGEALVTAFRGFDEGAHGRPSVSASLGIAVSRSGPATALLRDADLAMYQAKQRGGATAVEFEPWMAQKVLERSRMLTEMESAVDGEAFVVHLQPIVDLTDRSWVGFEALVRWPGPEGLIGPDRFIPFAEESGLIVPLGRWVLTEALEQLCRRPEERMRMAVNVSAVQLADAAFIGHVMDALASTGISPDRLVLEITEQTAIADLGRAASRLDVLRAAGVQVAIDDFGTGFSSMQYLSRLPIDILKIDRRFVDGLGRHREDEALVRSMIGLAADLGLKVVAEGVETELQAELLTGYGCLLAQGYLFSRPLPSGELVPPGPVRDARRLSEPTIPA